MQRAVRLGLAPSAHLTRWGFTKEKITTQIRAADDRTLIVTLDRAYPAGLILSAAFPTGFHTFWTVRRGRRRQDAGRTERRRRAFFRANPICVGPYKVTRWDANDVVILERNDIYYGTPARLKRVIIRHVPESGAQRLLLEQGDIDVARSIERR